MPPSKQADAIETFNIILLEKTGVMTMMPIINSHAKLDTKRRVRRWKMKAALTSATIKWQHVGTVTSSNKLREQQRR